MRVVLISCVAGKREVPLPARELYTSAWFRYALRYAERSGADSVFILSAKYGLVALNDVLAPYDATLNKMRKCERDAWGKVVLEQLAAKADLRSDSFVLLAGERYRKPLVGALSHWCAPMAGMGIGKQLAYLKNATETASGDVSCSELHALLGGASRFEFPYDSASIPNDGLYVLFERGEVGHGGDRIVRIGTHTGRGQLRSRLHQHFEMENKNRSIFRKNIGRALLVRDGSDYLPIWELDTTSKAAKRANAGFVDYGFEQALERRISRYIQERFSFAVIEEPDKDRRLQIESRLISTVSHCTLCRPSNGWLGLSSTKWKIRESGLWQVNELWKTPVDQGDLEKLRFVVTNQ